MNAVTDPTVDDQQHSESVSLAFQADSTRFGQCIAYCRSDAGHISSTQVVQIKHCHLRESLIAREKKNNMKE